MLAEWRLAVVLEATETEAKLGVLDRGPTAPPRVMPMLLSDLAWARPIQVAAGALAPPPGATPGPAPRRMADVVKPGDVVMVEIAAAGPAQGRPAARSERVAAFRQNSYLYMVIGVVGTTIAPWMQFYLQSSIVEKGVTRRQYKTSKLDVIVGCIFTDVVAWFIIVACAATLYVHGHRDIRDAADAAQSLRPLAGDYAYILFALGLFNASLFAASILPLSTAYTVCEGLGFESGVGRKFSEAPAFYWLYTALIVAGGAVILIPGIPLVKITVFSQVVNGAVLPFVLIFMLLLINKKELMGEYVNQPTFNIIAWATTAIMILLTALLVYGQLSGGAG